MNKNNVFVSDRNTLRALKQEQCLVLGQEQCLVDAFVLNNNTNNHNNNHNNNHYHHNNVLLRNKGKVIC